MSIFHNIAGYKFITLEDLPSLRSIFLEKCTLLGIKGTILLAQEGINLSLAGENKTISEFKSWLKEDVRFVDIGFKESFSAELPFNRMKVKLRKEIITIHRSELKPEVSRAPRISPKEFKRWLDENRDIAVLDTRNDYEVQFGTFDRAINLKLNDFSEFPDKILPLPKEKPIVMFCTGGIRCEKAAIHLLNEGFKDVFQLDGGILNYFAEVGGDHYHGECFVFDGRVALNSQLESTGAQQCQVCQNPIKSSEHHGCN